AAAAANSIQRAARGHVGLFACQDFLEVPPQPTDLVLYLDPPYRGTTGYYSDFDHARFDELVQQWAQYTRVFVSEYTLPYGKCIFEKRKHVGLRSGKNAQERAHATERLFLV